MRRNSVLHGAALAALTVFGLSGSDARNREFSIEIGGPEAEYAVETAGSMDPENLEITIENLGDAPVVNPRITVNGLYDWYDVESIVAEVTRDAKTDEEKALALWQWVLYKRFQRSPDGRSALHPVRAMNGYGYGICGHTSAWLKRLWQAAGLDARVQEIWGHTVAEAYYNGGWHMLDGNVKVFYLDRDNRSIASLAALERDGWLIERTIHARDHWLRRPEGPEANREYVNYIVSYKDNYEEHSYDEEIAKDYSMAMTLKPGEKLIRWWGPELGKFEGAGRRPEVPERYANGRLIWAPDLRRVDVKPYLSIPHYGNVATRTGDGPGPAIRVADLQDSLHTRPSVFTIPIRSPYPIVGGRFVGTLVKEGSAGRDSASVFFGQPGWEYGDLYEFRWGEGSRTVEVDLDSRLRRGGAVYEYGIGFAIRGNAESRPPAQAGVEAFRSVTDLQVSPHSLPALALGRNTVRFRSESRDARIRITHRWREIDGQHPPRPVDAAVSPGDGGQAAGFAPTLRWAPTTDPDPGDMVVDYQVMVSLRPDCRWPLSPSLHRNVGAAKTEWKLPSSFLNPGTTYYWKVRARDSHGNIGAWSRPFRFTTAGDAK
ncbi:MAG: hypothetical protein KIT09_13890 [Bryobacteraceae bacterium]|nr:hypothetical protein [Bryobacteraceae bacterium]